MDILSQENIQKLIHYDPETGIVIRLVKGKYYNKGSVVTSKDAKGRLIYYYNNKQYKLHRIIWLYMFGYFPKIIDHINGNSADNRLCNLREATANINQQNRRRANTNNKSSKMLGVSKKRNKWSAQIRSEGKILRLGCYDTAKEAYAAYLIAKRQHHEGCTL